VTQKERILDLLRIAGLSGVTPLDALAPVNEGGAGCYRLAARIADLRGEGHDIVTRTVNGHARYILYEPARGQLTLGVRS
jgi:hypothetical protein